MAARSTLVQSPGRVDGLPVGIQFVAPPHREDLLITAGLAGEETVAHALSTPVAL